MALDTFCSSRGTGFSRVDVLVGYRHMQLTEHLGVTENLSSLSAEIPVSFQIHDQFDTRNQFHGIDLGMTWQAGWNKWSVDLLVKTALGHVQQDVDIQGWSTASVPGELPVSTTEACSRWRRIWEAIHRIVLPLCPNSVSLWVLRSCRGCATVGYSIVYWGTVVRPGDQIDLDVNPDQLPPPVVPSAGRCAGVRLPGS